MKEYTLIANIEGKLTVILTNDPPKYLDNCRSRKSSCVLRFCSRGDYRVKIKKFGINNFLSCMEGRNSLEELSLKVFYDK